MLWKWRYVSLASITAAAILPPLVWGIEGEAELTAMALAIAGIVIFKHHENIARLRAGTENKFKA